MLKEFIEQYGIDTSALERIKRRVLIVGRFSQKGSKDSPEIYLFSRRPDVTAAYRKIFSATANPDYDAFVRIVEPRLAERIEYVGNGGRDGRKLPMVIQVAPADPTSLSSETAVIDANNFFFVQGGGPSSSKDGTFNHSDTILGAESNPDPGEIIYKQLGAALSSFSAFQVHHPDLINTVAKVFQECTKGNALSFSYGEGDMLPGGFGAALMDYLYEEDLTKEFDIDTLDLSDDLWKQLRKPAGTLVEATKPRQQFRSILRAFRSYLLRTTQQEDTESREDGTPLSKRIGSIVTSLNTSKSYDLANGFQASRRSFDTIRQVLRSKVLLSMVLRWVLGGLEELKTVKAAASQVDANVASINQAIQEAILNKHEENQIAPPVPRPSRLERDEFSKNLNANLKPLLDSVLDSDSAFEGHLVALSSDEMRRVAREIRSDKEIQSSLKEISGWDNQKIYDASFDSYRSILSDVICPVMYQEPVLTSYALRERFGNAFIAAFKTAEFLSEENEEAFRSIGIEHRAEVEQLVTAKAFGKTPSFSAKLLKHFVTVMAQTGDNQQTRSSFRGLGRVLSVIKGAKGNSTERPSTIVAAVPFDRSRTVAAQSSGKERLLIAQVVTQRKATTAVEAARVHEVQSESQPGGSPISDRTTEPSSSFGGTAKEEESPAGVVQDSLLLTIDQIVARSPVSTTDGRTNEDTLTVDQIVERVLNTQSGKEFAEDYKEFEKALHKVYARYQEKGHDNPEFRKQVEQMTLANALLLFQRSLGIGTGLSNLYAMLLDLVGIVDPVLPDRSKFLRAKSLTEYFDNEDFQLENGRGITKLMNVLDGQTAKSLRNIVGIVSELHGIEYLLNSLNRDEKASSDAEVIVLNATASEFIQWIRRDSLTGDQGATHSFRPDMLTKSERRSDLVRLPAIVYMTEAAFDESYDQSSFLDELSTFEPTNGNAQVVVPPICLTPPNNSEWAVDAAKLAARASELSSPVVILAPAAPLNPPGDRFPTYLPAGYLFCGYLLSGGAQSVKIDGVFESSEGRFRVIGWGDLKASLRNAVWPSVSLGQQETYCFAADYYLYLISLMLSRAKASGIAAVNSKAFYSYFCYNQAVANNTQFNSSRILDKAFLGKNMGLFSLENVPTEEAPGINGVKVAENAGIMVEKQSPETLGSENVRSITIRNSEWFNRMRIRLTLP